MDMCWREMSWLSTSVLLGSKRWTLEGMEAELILLYT